MSLFTKQLNPHAILIELLYFLDPPVPVTEVINELNIHPDYPNLLALTDVLNNFGIELGAYRINSYELPDLPCPFIAHTHKSGSEYLLLKSLDTQTVVISDESKISFNEFEDIFDEVVLVPETNDTTVAQSKTFVSFSVKAIRYHWLLYCCFLYLQQWLYCKP